MRLHAGVLALFLLFLFSIAGCSSEANHSPSANDGINDWVIQNVSRHEKLLCKKELNGETFFVAVDGDAVKVGSRLDMTAYRTAAHSYLIGWVFQNEKGSPLATNIAPRTRREDYVSIGDKTYAEQIQYQTLGLAGSDRIRVGIFVKKCRSSQCDRQETNSKDELAYAVDLCDVALTK